MLGNHSDFTECCGCMVPRPQTLRLRRPQAVVTVTKAQWAVGQPASDELLERARVAADAGSARFLRPNQPVTMEYLGSRLNLGLDARDVVYSVVCG